MILPGVAQLVARVLWEHDAAGSNPVTRTTTNDPRVVITTKKQVGILPSCFLFASVAFLWYHFIKRQKERYCDYKTKHQDIY